MNIRSARGNAALKSSLREEFSHFLSRKGLKNTACRFVILDKCVDQRPHFDITGLYKAVRNDYSVSLASVYKTVELLCECNILHKHFLRENQAAYELAGQRHLHLICLVCGSVEVLEFGDDDGFDDACIRDLTAAGESRDFRPAYFSANVYGTCALCNSAKHSGDLGE